MYAVAHVGLDCVSGTLPIASTMVAVAIPQDRCRLGPFSRQLFSRVWGCVCFPQSSLMSNYSNPRAPAMFPQQTQPVLQADCELVLHPTLTCLEGLHCASSLLGVTGSTRLESRSWQAHQKRWGPRYETWKMWDHGKSDSQIWCPP